MPPGWEVCHPASFEPLSPRPGRAHAFRASPGFVPALVLGLVESGNQGTSGQPRHAKGEGGHRLVRQSMWVSVRMVCVCVCGGRQ